MEDLTTVSSQTLLEKLGLESLSKGLTDFQVKQRIQIHGLNIPPKVDIRTSLLKTLVSNLWLVLLSGVFASLLVSTKEQGSLSIISQIFLTGYFFGKEVFKQLPSNKEEPKDKTVAVIRDSKANLVDKKFLVPGDVVELSEEVEAPADMRVLVPKNCLVEFDSQVELNPSWVPRGATVVYGKAVGVVISTQTQNPPLEVPVSKILVFSVIWACILGASYYGLNTSYALACLFCYLGLPEALEFSKLVTSRSKSHFLLQKDLYMKNPEVLNHLPSIKHIVVDAKKILYSSVSLVEKVYISDKLTSVYDLTRLPSPDTKLLAHFLNILPLNKELLGPIVSFAAEVEARTASTTLYSTIKNLGSENTVVSLVMDNSENDKVYSVLFGEAEEVLKQSSKLYSNENYLVLPSRLYEEVIEEMKLQRFKCYAVAFMEMKMSEIQELELESTDVNTMYEYNFLAMLCVKDQIHNASAVMGSIQELPVNLVLLGKDKKEVLEVLIAESQLLFDKIQSKSLFEGSPNYYTPSSLKKAELKNQKLSVVGEASEQDTLELINTLGKEETCYIGDSHACLKLAHVGVSHTSHEKLVKDSSDLVSMNESTVEKVIESIQGITKTQGREGSVRWGMAGCFISPLVLAVLGYHEPSNFSLLYLNVGVPFTLQFVLIAFPRKLPVSPFTAWVLINALSVYVYFESGMKPSVFAWNVLGCFAAYCLSLHLLNYNSPNAFWKIIHSFNCLKLGFYLAVSSWEYFREELFIHELSYQDLLGGPLCFFILVTIKGLFS